MPKKFDGPKHSVKNNIVRGHKKKLNRGKGGWGDAIVDDPRYEEDYYYEDVISSEDEIDWEEQAWLAEHDNYESFFNDMAEPVQPQQLQEEDQSDIRFLLRRLIDSLVQGEIDSVQFVEEARRCNADGLMVARYLISPTLLNVAQGPLGEALDACVDAGLVTEQNVDHTFTGLLGSYLKPEDLTSLFQFAVILEESKLLSSHQVQQLEIKKDETQKQRQQIKNNITSFIREYFTSRDINEVLRCIHEFEPKLYTFEIIKILVNLSMDGDEKRRELASQLLGHPDGFSRVALRRGFEILLDRLDDIKKDVPDAIKVLACFIARVISDESLPPSFVQEAATTPNNPQSKIQCLQRVQYLLNMKLSAERLARVWGPGRGRPVAELKVAMSEMLEEYFLNSDLNELARSLLELNEPNFHHEFFKQLIFKCAEKMKYDPQMVVQLIINFVNKDITNDYQVRLGIKRVEKGLDNYKCDIPLLPKTLKQVKGGIESMLKQTQKDKKKQSKQNEKADVKEVVKNPESVLENKKPVAAIEKGDPTKVEKKNPPANSNETPENNEQGCVCS